jgi:hypothetical protein
VAAAFEEALQFPEPSLSHFGTKEAWGFWHWLVLCDSLQSLFPTVPIRIRFSLIWGLFGHAFYLLANGPVRNGWKADAMPPVVCTSN